ncbi:pyrimidine reductase family protein [soil metagenome]
MIRSLDLSGGALVDDLFDLIAAEARPSAAKPWLMVNMVSSLDGATAVRGGATGLTDADDQAMFQALRAVADVILVGASTVRSEDYGQVVLTDHQRSRRSEWGKPDSPRLAVVSASLDLDPDARLFAADGPRPYVFTGAVAPAGTLAERADLVRAGSRLADMGLVLDRLWADGHHVVLCEGGPIVNAQLAAADLIDELALSVSPVLVGGTSSRLLDRDAPFDPPLAFILDRVLKGERTLFSRYLRDRS